MLSAWEAIKNRRSIRKFTHEPVPEEAINMMLEAARLAPSAGNTQPWKFLVVRDPGLKKELQRICWNQNFIGEAPVVIVGFGNLQQYVAIGDAVHRYENYLPATDMQDKLNFVTANTAIAIEHMLIMATALGLGTTFVGGFSDASEFNRLLGLDRTLVPVGLIPLGYPAENPAPRPRQPVQSMLIHREEKEAVKG